MARIFLIQIPRLDDKLTWGIKEAHRQFDEAGCDVRVVDYNHIVYDRYRQTDQWQDIEDYCVTKNNRIPKNDLIQLFAGCMTDVRETDIVIFSVFTVESREFAQLLGEWLRKRFPQMLIGCGGQGVRRPGEYASQTEWGDWLLGTSLFDFMFIGHSDETVPEWVKNNFKPLGKIYKESKVFPKIGFLQEKFWDKKERYKDPLYKGTNFDLYKTDKIVPKLYFVQGCVKKCTFCDVHMIDNFVMQDPKDIIKEIDYYHNELGMDEISFADNTINSSNSQFIKLLQGMYDWMQNNNIDLKWSTAGFAVKPEHQLSDEMFQLITATNGMLSVGFDHVSDTVLDHMRKLYKWADIESFIHRADENGVTIETGLWITGYPTETEEDFKEYEKLTKLYKTAGNSILSNGVQPCSIPANSPLIDLVTIDWKQPDNWYNDIVDRNTRNKRADILTYDIQQAKTQGKIYFDMRNKKRSEIRHRDPI